MAKAAKSEVVVRFPGRDQTPTARDAVAEGGFDQRLCEHLIAAGKLTHPNMERALRLAAETPGAEPLRGLLVKLGLLSERDLAVAMASLMGLPLLERKAYPEPGDADSGVSLSFLKQRKALILGEEAGRLRLAMADPQDGYLLKAIRLITGRDVVPCVGIASEIEQALEDRAKGAEDTAGDELGRAGGAYQEDVEHLKQLASGAPVIRLVNQIMHRAVQAAASDVHIEPFSDRLMVRYRIDGVLREMDSPPASSAPAVISRVKIMANLNIAERRLPQDGRFNMRVAGETVDLRVSTVPTVYGESLVVRLLRRDDEDLDFGPLGYDPEAERTLRKILDLPHGVLLVTGPTGSGKTTTLYAALSYLNTTERKIITVEDPVEYNIDGINQIQVKPQIGLSFANALRSIVRQDPDVIMIGEMRDTETAKIAVQSALTGHLVLSTLHTNDAAGSITRMLDMGVEDYLLASTVNAVMAQRLVRNLCQECRQSYRPSPEEIQYWGLGRFTEATDPELYRAAGCEKCGGTGYRGRSAIVELMVMTDPLRRLVLEHAEAGKIAAQAAEEGMRSMFQDGLVKALAGITSIEELVRVTQED